LFGYSAFLGGLLPVLALIFKVGTPLIRQEHIICRLSLNVKMQMKNPISCRASLKISAIRLYTVKTENLLLD
jgi:hypothetical protein